MKKQRMLAALALTAVIGLSGFASLSGQVVKADTTTVSTVGVKYRSHVQNIGWQPYVSDGAEAGTDGKSLRVEALNMTLSNVPSGAHIEYQAHVQNIGWQAPVEDGAEAGTDGQSLRVEAIKIALVNLSGYTVQYRTYVQNVGWQPYVSDGAESGTDGKGLRIEAIEVRVVKTVDGSTPTPIAFQPATPVTTTAPQTSISGAELVNKLPSLGFVNTLGTMWSWDSKPNDATTTCGVINVVGNSVYFVLKKDTPTFDNNIKTIFNLILPTKGNLLYNTVSSVFSNQTQIWDGRKVLMNNDTGGVEVDIY